MNGVLYFDGACLPRNPGGVATFGWVLEWNGRKVRGEGIETENGTNNVAEYAGLVHGLEKALEKGIEEIVVRGDSQLVIYQLRGIYGVSSERIRPYYERANQLLGRFRKAHLEWIPREQNSEADELSTKAYVRHEFLKEWEKRNTVREWKEIGDGVFRVNGYEVKLSFLPLRFSCTCPSFEKKNSYPLLKKAGAVVPCKHVAFVYYTLLNSFLFKKEGGKNNEGNGK